MSLPDNAPTAMVRDIKTCNANAENVGACKKDIDFRLSTAAILSARFPLVTPVGWFKNENKEKYRLADGGYFDNSGLITAIDVGQSLERYLKDTERDDEVEVRYISLIGQADEAAKGKVAADGLNETLSPIRALLNSRSALGQSIFEHAKYLLQGERKLRPIFLDAQNLPLGWYLSEPSQDKIKRQITFPISELEGALPALDNDDAKNHNKKMMTSIICELTSCENKS